MTTAAQVIRWFFVTDAIVRTVIRWTSSRKDLAVVPDQRRRSQLGSDLTILAAEADITFARVPIQTIDTDTKLTDMIGTIVEIFCTIDALPSRWAFASKRETMSIEYHRRHCLLVTIICCYTASIVFAGIHLLHTPRQLILAVFAYRAETLSIFLTPNRWDLPVNRGEHWHEYSLIWSRHVPLFKHRCETQSSMFVSHRYPV